MQEREFAREGMDVQDFIVDTPEELEKQYRESRTGREKEMRLHGTIHIKSKDCPWHINTQGPVRRYVGDWSTDTANKNITIFHTLIPGHSGKHSHQGGFSLFILEGKGYTTVDGVRHDWEEGDLVLLPIKPGGVEHQHFNLRPGKASKWMAITPTFSFDAVGFGVEQREVSPYYQLFHQNYMGQRR